MTVVEWMPTSYLMRCAWVTVALCTTGTPLFGLAVRPQCRRLTVVSRQDDPTASARLDLDEVALADDWMMEIADRSLELLWADQ